jgi:circadian clock protein KaiC
MVDGILELEYGAIGSRRVRELTVTKLRGSGFSEGRHTYVIGSHGVRVYPRFEATFGRTALAREATGRAAFGIPALDAMLSGGVAHGSSTLALGSSGAGKTLLGLHFLAAGADAGERGLHFGFYEDPAAVTHTADRLGLRFGERLREGALRLEWRPAAEASLDPLGHDLVAAVSESGAKRLFLDGVEALRTAPHPERLGGFFHALTQELRTRGVTTLITAEARQLLVREVEVPVSGISGVVENILVMRHVEIGSEVVRALTIIKTRDRAHEGRLVRFTIGPRGLELAGEVPPPVVRVRQAPAAGKRPRPTRGRGKAR